MFFTIITFFFIKMTATTEFYTYLHTLSLHSALPILTLITHGMGSMAWPFALATAAVASLLSADAVARSMRSQSPAARMGASYAAAFIGFKLGILDRKSTRLNSSH